MRNKPARLAITLLALHAGAFAAMAQVRETAAITVHVGGQGKAISPDLFGIFFEDLNYAADGGLYAELVQNRSFEYTPADNKDWNPLTAWELVQREGGAGSVDVEEKQPLNENNPHYAVLTVRNGGGGVGLQNSGFDGIVLKAGDKYDLSLFARLLEGDVGPLSVRLESKSGELLGEAGLVKPDQGWKKYMAIIKVKQGADDGRLVLLAKGTGRVALDVVSLFPEKTFHDHPNGLRADLAGVIADLKPKFVRFPGGCVAHGDGLDNIYQWKETIGPVEQRREQRNIWHYHQSVGLGYFEYFQFCEDIGARPLPVVAAGVCCQNANASLSGKWGVGQQGLPMILMPAYIQDILDLIEYANGPVTSTWGAKRAAAGHPNSFHLQYLGIGNEDKMTPVFKERFKMIYEAVRAKHPEITIIGTVGPDPDGQDFEEGWKLADELQIAMVDEHYYKPPQWFLDHPDRYDTYDRRKSKVYVGEYAAHDTDRKSTLRSALAEAAYMTNLERNGDVVRMASYAPLLGKLGHTQWNPDLIYFTNTTVAPTINYYVQQMFGTNSGDTWLPATVDDAAQAAGLAISSVRKGRSGDLILKFVNNAASSKALHIDLSGVEKPGAKAVKTVLAGDPDAVNDSTNPKPLVPSTETISIGPAFDYEAPPDSLTVFRITNSTEPTR